MVLKAAIIIVALMIALNKTKSLSGAAGTWATKAGTAVFGTALAGTALVGRHTIGRGARALADSDAGKRFIAKTGVVGEVTDRALRATSSGTMDIRGIPGMDKAGLGRPSSKGGFDKYADRQVKRKDALAKHIGDVKMYEYEQGPSGEKRIAMNADGTYKYQTKINEKGETVFKTGKDVYTENLAGTKPILKYEQGPSGEVVIKKDSSGNVVYETEEKSYYDKKTKEERKWTVKKTEDTAWGQINRKAAKNIRKGKTKEQELVEELKKQLKEETQTPEEVAVAPKETEKPKET